ncbi:hypothetical protein ISCGN_031613 [Ixodes scapularis]
MLAVDCRSGSPSNRRRLAFRNAPQQSWARLNFPVRRGMRSVAVDQSQFAKKITPKRMRDAGNYIRFVPFFPVGDVCCAGDGRVFHCSRVEIKQTLQNKIKRSPTKARRAHGVTEAECKRRWRLIRDRYAKESKGAKGKGGAGRGDVTQPTGVLYKFLGFLDGQIHRRKSTVRAPASRASNTGQTNEPSSGCSSQANGAAPAATKRPTSPEGPRPPAPKWHARSIAQHIRMREEFELLKVNLLCHLASTLECRNRTVTERLRSETTLLPPGLASPSGFGVLRAAARSSSKTWVALDSIRGAGPRHATSAYEPCARNDQRFLASRVQTYPGFDSTTRMPFSPDMGKPRTARRGRANPYCSRSGETPLSKHLLSQVRVFLLQNVGIIVGVALLFLMATYSEKIYFEPGAVPPGVRITAASLGAGTHSGDSKAVLGSVGL